VRKLVPHAAGLLLVVLALVLGARLAVRAMDAPADEAADALPVYLATVTLAEGRDPGDREQLRASYEARGLRARAATYSTLYPASLPALLRPAGGMGWPSFVGLWRGLLLLGLFACGLVGCIGRPLLPWARGVAPGVGLLVLVLIPASGECVRLGQANMLLAGLLAVAFMAVGRGRDGVGGAALAVGVAIKLVPGLALLPLIAARRWRAVAVAAVVGGLCLGLASWLLPLDAIVAAVLDTARFQASIHPDWAARHAQPLRWLGFVAALRHGPLLLLTLAVGLPAVVLAPRRAVILPVLAMVSAWLGCTAGAFHVLYAPLLYPALLFVVAWPMEADAERGWSHAGAGLALAAAAAAFLLAPPTVVLEARVTLLGMLLWGLAALRLWRAWRALPRPEGAFALRALAWYPVGVALVLGGALAWTLPGGRPKAPSVPPALQEEIGAGFILPGDPAPGQAARAEPGDHRRTGVWPQVAVGATLEPGSHGAVTRHLELGVATWQALADQPQAGPWAHWVLEASPPEPVHEALASELLRYLVREGWALDALVDEPALDRLRASHGALLVGEDGASRERRPLGG
jgi:hypothetical protein